MAIPEPEGMQAAVDEIVRSWPDVRAKNVFGHRGYVRTGKLIGFLARPGVAVRAFSDEVAATLYARDGVSAFAYGGGEMKGWPVLPLRTETELETALSALQDAYDAVSTAER